MHVPAWQEYVTSAQEIGVFESLKQRLVQLRFPIEAGISQTEAYKSATRKGVLLRDTAKSPGLVLEQPNKLQLIVHESLAGAIPVLIASQAPRLCVPSASSNKAQRTSCNS
ncbi:hypothetical protein DSM106972_046400 [Dulcicalothrix desertica PCC 7102]|uniref:Uncharacterized protein n=1 Tax=Dulcicalothrix desertica PCC 7102 TaxID=232991 RepID=A0A433VE66_9CYAN|nr:hypothetical protein [Dulcicalothrix desertica]RUT04412.1 hypothetical protein DSM106972_046400 [Dulcicalothrix desertica PCC 7102]